MIDGAFANPQVLGKSGPVRERGGNALLNAALQGGPGNSKNRAPSER
jgi:hypothetical protein